MKNKAVTYGLIVVVALVWGLIFYRIFNAVGEDEGTIIGNGGSAMKEKKTVLQDSFELLLDYRDPFLGGRSNPSTHAKKSFSTKKMAKSTLPEVVDWSTIAYLGVIRNKQMAKEIGLLTINGHEVMASANQQVGVVRVLKIYPDSVRIVYNRIAKTIHKSRQ